jgi:hypothetical protein
MHAVQMAIEGKATDFFLQEKKSAACECLILMAQSLFLMILHYFSTEDHAKVNCEVERFIRYNKHEKIL